jgi:MoxR-like ATPase
MLYATELGVLALGVIHEILTEDRDKEFFDKYWCDEKEKVLYPYRFTIKLHYINKHVNELLQSVCMDPCKIQPSVFSREKLVERTKIEYYINSRGIKYRILTRNIARIKPEVVKYVIEFLENKIKEGIFEPVTSGYVLKEPGYQLEELIKNVQTIKELIILLHLVSGKNILLLGPPGSGKTNLLKDMLEKLKIKYMIETGNPDWTPFDTLGGYSIGSPENFKKGFIFEAAEQCRQAIERGELYWLIIDEINRANVDLAFGKFFTLLDPAYRFDESLCICGPGNMCKEIQVPLSFRVLATMNSYDRALLFKLGYALTRRFAVINHTFIESFLDNYMRKYENAVKEGVLEKILKISEKGYEESVGLNFELIKKDLTLCRKDLPHDCITPLDFKDHILQLGDEWREDLYSIQTTNGVIRLDNVITYLVHEINEDLRKFVDCEVCPVEVTPGVIAGALKYIALGVYASKKGLVKLSQIAEISSSEHVSLLYTLLLLDTAFSTYIIPQLDILADYASREKLQRGVAGPQQTSKENTASGTLERIKKLLASHGLIYSSSLVEKLSKGYHVY